MWGYCGSRLKLDKSPIPTLSTLDRQLPHVTNAPILEVVMETTLPESGISPRSAAAYIGVHPKSVYRIMRRGELQPFVAPDGRMMLSREELYSYLKRKEATRGK